MFIRAIIVLLVALNLGVGAWWALQPEPAPRPPSVQPPGIPRLQLLGETQARTVSPPAAMPTVATTATPAMGEVATTGPTQCFSLGPFAGDAALAASTRLQSQVVRLRVRPVSSTPARGYNVVLPPFASRELAQAAAARLVAAGFNDLLVLNDGLAANGIALGRYGSQEAASRHQAALQAAGFPAQLQPVDGGATTQWLDVEVREGFDIGAARTGTGAPQQQVIECAGLG